MTAETINRKIARGFAKVGQKLGYLFDIYRPDSYSTPLGDRNLVMTVPLSWSEDDAFKKNPEGTLVPFILFCDYTLLQPGDFVSNSVIGRTFAVTEINPIRGAVAFQTPERVNILRTVFNATDDKKTGFEEVMRSLPAAIEFKSAGSADGILKTVNSNMKTGLSNLEMWTWVPAGSIKLNDVIEHSGKRWLIVSADSTSSGTRVSAMSMRAGT